MAVTIERNADVFTVILDRPEVRNAVDKPTAKALAAAFREFDSDDSAKVAVLWGAGGHFCAGADLKAVAEGSDCANRLQMEGDAPMGISRLRLAKPVIAAVSGYCVAGGLELALWCDLRVAEQSSVFGVFCRRWGVPLIDGGTIRLPRAIGASRAMDMILTGRPVAADEALQMGLANRVVADGAARQAAEELAQQVAAFPQQCMRADRRSAINQWSMGMDAGLANEFECGMEVVHSGETVAGATQFAGGKGRHGDFSDIKSDEGAS